LDIVGMAMELVFLGTGTSAGVPMIGCDCPVCRSTDPRDQRTRPSVLVRYADDAGTLRQYLVDTSPELRLQAVRQGLKRIDGVFYTHAHADHVFGLDDLRRFNAVMEAPVDIYAESETLLALQRLFPYVFAPHLNVNVSFVARLIAHEVAEARPQAMQGAVWTPLRLLHGRLPILGYRIDQAGRSLAYCTDVSSIPPQTYPLLMDLDVLVLDALRFRHHPTHFTVDQALEVVEQVKPRRTYFTHMAHDVSHADLEAKLPEHVYLAFDGLVVAVDGVDREGHAQAGA
jgi:phosphoribosyl 1,2-cyclic phosphate phosphodiesterase